MRNQLLMIILLIMILLATACSPDGRRMYPTIGPVRAGSSGNGVLAAITANTNCAEVNEVIAFTIDIANQRKVPITFTGALPYDVLLHSVDSSSSVPPTERWSTSDQYPGAPNPTLMPGEHRTYQWHWNVKSLYGQSYLHAILKTSAITDPAGPFTDAGDMTVVVGIGKLPLPQSSISCAEVKQQAVQF